MDTWTVGAPPHHTPAMWDPGIRELETRTGSGDPGIRSKGTCSARTRDLGVRATRERGSQVSRTRAWDRTQAVGTCTHTRDPGHPHQPMLLENPGVRPWPPLPTSRTKAFPPPGGHQVPMAAPGGWSRGWGGIQAQLPPPPPGAVSGGLFFFFF